MTDLCAECGQSGFHGLACPLRDRASHGAEPAKAAEPRSLGAIKRWAWSDDGMTEMADGAFVWFSDYTARASPIKAEVTTGEADVARIVAEVKRMLQDFATGHSYPDCNCTICEIEAYVYDLGVRAAANASLRAMIESLARERDEMKRERQARNKIDPITRLHNLCDGLAEHRNESPYNAEALDLADESYKKLCAENVSLRAKLDEWRTRFYGMRREVRRANKAVELYSKVVQLQASRAAYQFAARQSAQAAEVPEGAEPKFMQTFCSQCGCAFGPGNHGFSHCHDHEGMQ